MPFYALGARNQLRGCVRWCCLLFGMVVVEMFVAKNPRNYLQGWSCMGRFGVVGVWSLFVFLVATVSHNISR